MNKDGVAIRSPWPGVRWAMARHRLSDRPAFRGQQTRPIILATVLVLLVLVFAIWRFPQMQTGQQPLTARQRASLSVENELRRTVIQVAGGALAIVALAFTFWRIRVAVRQAHIAEQNLITTRFAEGVKLLSSGDVTSRLGGIYALERVAADSEVDHWPVFEVLTGFVRHVATITKDPQAETTLDVKAVLTVVARRVPRLEEHALDFSGSALAHAIVSSADLGGAEFRSAFMRKAILSGCDLTGANFSFANLVEASFFASNLAMAHLHEADLRNAFLDSAHFDGTVLYLTDLRGAWLEASTGWESTVVEGPFNVYGVARAPRGFLEWALANQGVEIKDDREWEAEKVLWRQVVESTRKALRDKPIRLDGGKETKSGA
jgi:hypothetical protein